MGDNRPERLVLLAVGTLLTALAVAHLLGGRHGVAVVTGLGAVLSFVLVILLARADGRRPLRP